MPVVTEQAKTRRTSEIGDSVNSRENPVHAPYELHAPHEPPGPLILRGTEHRVSSFCRAGSAGRGTASAGAAGRPYWVPSRPETKSRVESGKEIVEQPVERRGALEIDRVPRLRDPRQARPGNSRREQGDRLGRDDRVLRADHAQDRHPESGEGRRRGRAQGDQLAQQGRPVEVAVQRPEVMGGLAQRGLLPLHGGAEGRVEAGGDQIGDPVAREERVDLRVGERADGRRHDEGPDPLRRAQGVAEARPAAHRLRYQAHLAKSEMVDQGRQIVDEGQRTRTARLVARLPEAAMREGDAGVAGGEVRHLLPPGEVVAAHAVREDERGALAAHLVVQIAAGSSEEGHAAPLSRANSAVASLLTACAAAPYNPATARSPASTRSAAKYSRATAAACARARS